MYIGIDLGTSELKALLLDEQHRVLATAGEPLVVQRPQALWSEQDPQAWWQALDAVVLKLRAAEPAAMARVQGMGLSGQMHGAVLLDARQQVLRPCVLWNDGRSADQCARLSLALPALSQITGNLAMPGFTAPKLLWVQDNEPDVFARTRLVLLPKDWLRLQLTGEAVSEMSDAAGTLWLDTGRRDWSDAALQACGMDRSQMPRLVEGSAPSATLHTQLAQRWGMPAGVVVAGGAGDNAASAVGMGLVDEGQGFVSLGTSGVIFVSGRAFRPNPAQALHAFCHALPQRWHQMSVMLSAASAVTWAARQLGFANEAELLQSASTLGPEQRAQAPLFAPYLSGERSPHNNAHACASWTGLRAAHERADVAYAVAEGVALGLRDGWLSFGPHTGARSLSLVGGGSRSAWWAQLISSALHMPLTLHQDSAHGAALGAARLGWLACGADEHTVCLRSPVLQTLEPASDALGLMEERHTRFAAVYPALHPN